MIRIFFSIFYSNFITPQASRSYNVCFLKEESLWIRQTKPELFHSDSIRLHCRKIQNSVMNIFVAPSIVSVDILVIVKTMVISGTSKLCERTVPPFSDLLSNNYVYEKVLSNILLGTISDCSNIFCRITLGNLFNPDFAAIFNELCLRGEIVLRVKNHKKWFSPGFGLKG